jgi:FMN phosphatase YigB (HAD superfamily)
MKEQLYIVTQDTNALLDTIQPDKIKNTYLAMRTEKYLTNIVSELTTLLPEDVKVRIYKEQLINGLFEQFVNTTLKQDSNAIFLCLDRFLLQEKECEDKNFPLIRLSITRKRDGTKVPRVGNPSFENQIKEIKKRFPDIYEKSIYLIDDGFFTGGTLKDVLKIWNEVEGRSLPIQEAVGFIGKDDNPLDTTTIRINQKISQLYEWIDLRDFGPFGGKLLESSRNNTVATTVPYLFPWSDGTDASLNMSPDYFRFSERAINEAIRLVMAYEDAGGKTLTVRDLVRNGFGIPMNEQKSLPVTINTPVLEYLKRCSEIILEESNRPLIVFDMDGTLYQLNGKNNEYSGSTLEAQVNENALLFIADNITGGNKEKAKIIRDTGLSDPIGISNYIEQRYGISRQTYFDTVWNINPKNIVYNYESTIEGIRLIKQEKPNCKLVLLTSAPRVWAKNVLSVLNCSTYFESIYTGEQFKKKGEIFEMLAGRYSNTLRVSIGDQEKTDIIPAIASGFSGILISYPKELTDEWIITRRLFKQNWELDDFLDQEGACFTYTWAKEEEL